MVSNEASGRQRSERKESSVGGSRDREGGTGKEPKVRGGGGFGGFGGGSTGGGGAGGSW